MIRWTEAADPLLPGQPPDVMIGRAHGRHQPQTLVAWLEDLRSSDAPRVGGKAAYMGEMRGTLARQAGRVPEGFVTTVDAWDCFLDTPVGGGAWDLVGSDLRAICPVAFHNTTLREALKQVFEEADANDQLDLHMRAALARALVLASPVPEPVARALGEALKHLLNICGGDVDLAIHASATDDAGVPSFAGRYESCLNVRGVPGVQAAWRKCCASAFTGAAVGYQIRRGVDPLASRLGIVIMRMNATEPAAARNGVRLV